MPAAGACQVVCVSGAGIFLSQVWFYSVGIGQGEDAERFVPALSEGAFDEDVVRLMPVLAGSSVEFDPFKGAFVFDVADGQPEQFHGRLVIREMPPVLGDLAQLVVQ